MESVVLIALVYAALGAGVLAVVYYLIKLAVFNAIVEAHNKINGGRAD